MSSHLPQIMVYVVMLVEYNVPINVAFTIGLESSALRGNLKVAGAVLL